MADATGAGAGAGAESGASTTTGIVRAGVVCVGDGDGGGDERSGFVSVAPFAGVWGTMTEPGVAGRDVVNNGAAAGAGADCSCGTESKSTVVGRMGGDGCWDPEAGGGGGRELWLEPFLGGTSGDDFCESALSSVADAFAFAISIATSIDLIHSRPSSARGTRRIASSLPTGTNPEPSVSPLSPFDP